MRLYLVRHGETAYNADGRGHGSIDIPLNERGREQARALSDRMRDTKIDAFYSSTLGRAYETALIVAEPHKKPVMQLADLCEINYGKLEGMLHKDLNEFRANKTVPYAELQFPDGESYSHAHMRARNFLARIKEECGIDDVVFVVSHGSFIRVIISEITGDTIEELYEKIPRQKNTAITVIDLDQSGVSHLIQTADAQHLDI